MKTIKFICILRDVKNLEDYVKENQNNSFAEDQRLISKNFRFIRDVFDDYGCLDIFFNLSIKYAKDLTIWKEHKTEINIRVKRYLKSNDAKFTDKAIEIENIIQAIVQGISVDDKRLFTIDDKRELLAQKESQGKKYQCEICKKWFYEDELQVDHIEAWSKGGRTVLSNAQLLCGPCNRKKGNV